VRDVMGHGRVLIADSVFESADLTVRDGVLYIEFEAEDLESVSVDLRPLNLCPEPGSESQRGG
jgi:hypothetical protein